MTYVRNEQGSMLAITSAVTAVIVVPILIVLVAITLHFVHHERAESVVEAASKVAARDLSRIVLKSDAFGYVALSNYEPGGKRTQSKDGEALPVVSLHAWQATIDQAKEIAAKLQNPTMASLAQNDQMALDASIAEITRQMESSAAGDPRDTAFDKNGSRVDTLRDVQTFLTQNLPGNVQLVSMQLTVGCLAGEDADAPCDPQAHLVSPTVFVQADGKHIPSIVKLECTFKTTDATSASIVTTACSQGFCDPDRTIPGTMNVRFPGRPVIGLLSWNEFLMDDNFSDNQVVNYDVIDGDFPVDKYARLRQAQSTTDRHATPHDFSRHLYYWLRSAHGRLKTDAVLGMMNESFLPYLNQAYTYTITADGGITRTSKEGVQGTVALAADGESVVMADTRIKSGASVVVLFHDNVENLDADSAKHGGQPLQGLSLDIEIGGTGDSTARADVISARERTKHRKV